MTGSTGVGPRTLYRNDPVLHVGPDPAAPGTTSCPAFIQYCPAAVQGGWTPAKRDAFGKTVIDQICNYSPNFRDLIAHMEVRTPYEIEHEIGLTEGNIFQES